MKIQFLLFTFMTEGTFVLESSFPKDEIYNLIDISYSLTK